MTTTDDYKGVRQFGVVAVISVLVGIVMGTMRSRSEVEPEFAPQPQAKTEPSLSAARASELKAYENAFEDFADNASQEERREFARWAGGKDFKKFRDNYKSLRNGRFEYLIAKKNKTASEEKEFDELAAVSAGMRVVTIQHGATNEAFDKAIADGREEFLSQKQNKTDAEEIELYFLLEWYVAKNIEAIRGPVSETPTND